MAKRHEAAQKSLVPFRNIALRPALLRARFAVTWFAIVLVCVAGVLRIRSNATSDPKRLEPI
jgi:hypothetical protein